MKALCVDLYCGLGGWAKGFLAEGYDVIGFDIERHDYGSGGYPGHLVIQDVLTLHGSQFKNAAVIVASPPCTEYSYMAMPWTRAKRIVKALRGHGEFPTGYTGSRTIAELNALFDACFRIQREACEAAGRYIPLIVENVRGAQPWVGRAKAAFGSYYLWGDVGMVGKRVVAGVPRFGVSVQPMNGRKNGGGSWFAIANNTESGHSMNPVSGEEAQKRNPDGTDHPAGSWFKIADSKNRGAREGVKIENQGLPLRHPQSISPQWRTKSYTKVPGLNFSGYGQPGYKAQGFNVTAAQRYREGTKFSQSGDAWFDGTPRDKMLGDKGPAAFGSKSNSRKAASAQIAEIPYPLARYIASCFREGRDGQAQTEV